MDAQATVRAYYDALRGGDALAPFFAREPTVVKFGIGERLRGFGAIESGLAEQTETTHEWVVDSRRLDVTERDEHAWFADEVSMAWTDHPTGERYGFESRWSGTLERRPDAAGPPDTPWRFVGMHVSAPGGTR